MLGGFVPEASALDDFHGFKEELNGFNRLAVNFGGKDKVFFS